MNRLYLAAFALMAFPAAAQTTPPPQQPSPEIHAQGCVEPGVELRCLVLKDTATNTLYNLIVKGDRPSVGAAIEFTGAPFQGMTYCMQGTPVEVLHWEIKSSLQCPAKAKPEAH